MNTSNDRQIDKIDRKILDMLAIEGRITVTELASRVGLSKTPCQTRLQNLQRAGIIQGFRAIIAPEILNRGHIAFVEVKLSDTREKALQSFNTAVRTAPEIEECHMIAGSFDYLLKVRSKDIQGYRRILGEIISTLPHVAHSSTHVVMEPVKDLYDLR